MITETLAVCGPNLTSKNMNNPATFDHSGKHSEPEFKGSVSPDCSVAYAVFSQGDPVEWHSTEEAAIADAELKIQAFRDDAIFYGEWDIDSEVTSVFVFKTVRRVKMKSIDDGCDVECFDAVLVKVD